MYNLQLRFVKSQNYLHWQNTLCSRKYYFLAEDALWITIVKTQNSEIRINSDTNPG